jgi:hypothetical protein
MAPTEACAQRTKSELDLQLNEELKGAFPASDPPKILAFKRFSQNCEPVVEERYCSKIEA